MTRLIFRRYVIIALMLSLGFSPALYAHLLPAQRGTLNFVDDGAFMALSLPISAFEGIDDDKNGSVSMVEFNKHRADIVARVQAGIVLSEKGEDRLLKGILLSPVSSDEHDEHGDHKVSGDAGVSRVYVMGKFVLDSLDSELRFRNSLYGKQSSERTFKISAKRKSGGLKQDFELTPEASSMKLFAEKKISNKS